MNEKQITDSMACTIRKRLCVVLWHDILVREMDIAEIKCRQKIKKERWKSIQRKNNWIDCKEKNYYNQK